MSLLVRERPPLRLIADVLTPDGASFRWAGDAPDPRDVPNGLSFGTTMPGGFEQATVSLARESNRKFADLDEFSTVTWRGVTGDVAFQGRIQAAPRSAGDTLNASPEIVGWQAGLDDATNVREIFCDLGFGNWGPASVQRKLNLASSIDCDDPSVGSDPATGQPALILGFSGAWYRAHRCEAFYDAHGVGIGTMFGAWKINPSVIPTDTNWNWATSLATDDVLTSFDITASLRAAGPGTITQNALNNPGTPPRKWGRLEFDYNIAAGNAGANYAIYWTTLAVYGLSGIPRYGTASATTAQGFLASDAMAYLLGKYCPRIGFTTGNGGTIQPTSFIVPQGAYLDPTTVSVVQKDLLQYDLEDWAVWEGPTYWMNLRGKCSNSRRWVSRIRQAQLQDAGPQADRMYNGAVVQYTDVAGVSRSAGPPGSGCSVEDPSLYDPDPQNPLNEIGIDRYTPPLPVGTTTAPGAIQIGARALQELKVASSAGQATLVGHVQDADTGLWWPSWMVRAGDEIAFVDAADTSSRRIVSTNYNDDARANSVQLDSPPDTMQALLARLSESIRSLGLS